VKVRWVWCDACPPTTHISCLRLALKGDCVTVKRYATNTGMGRKKGRASERVVIAAGMLARILAAGMHPDVSFLPFLLAWSPPSHSFGPTHLRGDRRRHTSSQAVLSTR
jgi:hypothetical protein